MAKANFVVSALSDPRRRCVPLAERCVYDEILRMAESIGHPSIRFGKMVPTVDDLAQIICCSPNEIETAIATLIRIGLLRRCDDGAISVLAAQKQFDQSQVNRANGGKGGRPRKNSKQD